MNPPQVYTCSPSWTPLPPLSPYHPSQSSQCTSPKHPVSCIKSGLVIRFIYVIIHVSMPFFQIIPPSSSPTESRRVFYTSVSLLLSCIQGYRYHLSKFHICALVYCIGVFLSAYFTLYDRLQFHQLIRTDSNVFLFNGWVILHCVYVPQTAFRMGENNSKWSNWQRTNLKNIQATPATQFQKNKWPNQKMGHRTKQTFLQRRHTDG